MTTYTVDRLKIITRKLPVNARDFVSWANVWLLTQIIIVLQAVQWAWGMKIEALVVAVAMLWLIWVAQKI